jgi:hypothetical protein
LRLLPQTPPDRVIHLPKLSPRLAQRRAMTADFTPEQRIAVVAEHLAEQARELARLYRITEAEARELLAEGLKGDAEPLRVYGPPIVRTT